jgi:hypothetical protein
MSQGSVVFKDLSSVFLNKREKEREKKKKKGKKWPWDFFPGQTLPVGWATQGFSQLLGAMKS